MKKLIAGGVAALAIAAAIPLVASAHGDRGEGGGHGMRGGHHGEDGMRGQHRGQHREGHGGRGAMIHLTEMLETHDADGDGSISQAEVDEWRANRLREFDRDGDGQLSLDEYQALWLDAMRERMVDQFQEHDDDGDGQVTVDEFGERTSRLVMMRDRNGDGVLSMDDARQARGGGGRHMVPGMQGGAMPGMQGGPMQGMPAGTMPGMPGMQGSAPSGDANGTAGTSESPGNPPVAPAAGSPAATPAQQ